MLQKFHCEHVLAELKEMGPYQKTLLFGFIMPMAILVAFQTNHTYNEFVPDHWCRVPVLVNFSYGEQHRLIRPRISQPDGTSPPYRLSRCEMYDIDYRRLLAAGRLLDGNHSDHASIGNTGGVIPIKKCTDGWVYDRRQFRENAAMHYNFVCDRTNDPIQTIRLIRKLSSALLGLVYAIFSDRYGRKKGLLMVLVAFLLSAISPLLTTRYQMFLVCQTINGSTWPSAILIAIIFGIEFVPAEYRSDVMAAAGVSYHFGQWLAFLIASLLPHWVWITIGNTGLVIPFFLFYHYCDESPQWLLATKRFRMLRTLFEKINRINDACLDLDSINSIISKFTHYYNHDRSEEVSMAISMQSLPVATGKQHCGRAKFANNNNNNDGIRMANKRKSLDSFLSDDDDDDTATAASANGGHHHRRHSIIRKIRLFIKRSTLFQFIFLWAIIMATNELTIDYLIKQKNHFDDNILIDHFLGSLIRMPIIIFAWYLVNQRTGRRWSNCIILGVNFILLCVFLFGHHHFKHIVWLNVSVSVLGIMMAECSELITILQTIELTPTRFRVTVASIVHCLSQLLVLAIIYYLYNHQLRHIFTPKIKLIFIAGAHLLSIVIASFITETRNEFLPLGALESEQLITNFNFWSLAKTKADIAPSNLFLTLSRWDINANHQISTGGGGGSTAVIKHMEKFTDS